jgi:hypothetical protein
VGFRVNDKIALMSRSSLLSLMWIKMVDDADFVD